MIRAIVKKPFQPFEIVEIEPTIETYYNIIETDMIGVQMISDQLQMVYADSAILEEREPNIKLRNTDYVLFGTLIFIQTDAGGENESMTEPEARYWRSILNIYFRSFSKEEAATINPMDYYRMEIIRYTP